MSNDVIVCQQTLDHPKEWTIIRTTKSRASSLAKDLAAIDRMIYRSSGYREMKWHIRAEETFTSRNVKLDELAAFPDKWRNIIKSFAVKSSIFEFLLPRDSNGRWVGSENPKFIYWQGWRESNSLGFRTGFGDQPNPPTLARPYIFISLEILVCSPMITVSHLKLRLLHCFV